MPSIIVFSKDRPLQTHAYLESLFKFSDACEKDVTILLCENKFIDYSKLINEYPQINWVQEKNFNDDLIESIEKSGSSHLMFGCDDVVFTGDFSLSEAQNFLQENDDVFGFSFRLGTNIKPMPDLLGTGEKYLKWNWETTSARHYDYPWELCCTLYRKSDVIEIISEYNKRIKSPNFFEADIALESKKYVRRPNLACSNEKSKAIVISVNAVQDTHINGFDDRKPTDIYTLNNLYNNLGNRLDIDAISNTQNNLIHVESEYFILKDPVLSWRSDKKAKSGKGNSFRRFFKNIAYLFKYDIKDIRKKSVRKEELDAALDGVKYEISDDIKKIKKPDIASAQQTINDLISQKASFCRFGDGEYGLMKGESLSFQEYDEKLSLRLFEVFQSNNKDIFVGIPYSYYGSVEKMRPLTKRFVRSWVAKNRPLISSLTIPGKKYYDTECSQLYANYENYNFEEYFESLKGLWKGRDVTIICGKTVFDNIENNIFDCSKSVEYQYAAAKNAFSDYENILSQAKEIDKNRLIIIILGPTATVLSYDLALLGYQAIDFGHIAKDYDHFFKKIDHDSETLTSFFKPD
ncbi:GT-D fold domain-containing glycosyltransferase [Endozoicomonadaceae bacterium StTr2]